MPSPKPSLEVDTREGRMHLVIRGPLRLAGSRGLLEEARRRLESLPVGDLAAADIHLDDVPDLDAGALSVLLQAKQDAFCRGMDVRVTATREAHRALIALLDRSDCPAMKPPPEPPSLFEQAGEATYEILSRLGSVLAFVGDVSVATVRLLRRPRLLNVTDTVRLMERAGADGFPIVVLMNFLVGLVMGFQGAIQLKQFGADLFVADLVALVHLRELGPLMTAVIVAGRSGASFAAELGTMRVSEEVDALHTLGLDPYHFLVLPRLIALVAVVPLLTVIGDLVGIAGGLVVGVASLDLTTSAYLAETRGALELWDAASGVVKSVVFAAAIALIACQRGLATRGGAEAVGRSTTSAVVTSIFSLVVIDALFSVVFHLLEL